MRRFVPLILLSVTFYVFMAYGGSIYGSYRYEKSGVQYAIPPVLSVFVLLLGTLFALWLWRLQGPWHLLVVWAAGVVVLALPAVGMSLTDAALECARWAAFGVATLHAVLLAAFLARQRRVVILAPPA